MQQLVEKIRRLRFSWNNKQLTEADFYRLCRRFRIDVQELPLQTNGFYYCLKGRHFIVIDSRLTGHKKLFVMFHELAHFLMHAPDSGVTANFHGIGKRTRKEIEADAFALCAMLPKSWIEKLLPHEICEHEGISQEMLAERLSIYKNFGI